MAPSKLLILIIVVSLSFGAAGPHHKMPRLKVNKTGHYLDKENGQPFFWLGDTGWNLFSKLNREQARQYLQDRREKKFTVIQAHLLCWQISGTNAYGNTAFINHNFDTPNELYWDHADKIIKMAEEYGLYMALLPAWASTYTEIKKTKDGETTTVFPLSTDTLMAYRYAKFLGKRYKRFTNIIWILGGDVWGRADAIYENLAKGLTETYAGNDANKILISFHPQGGTYRPPATSSSEFYGSKAWLDFNMIQSGHTIGNKNYLRIASDYSLQPAKPTLDAEPCYEQHPVQHDYKKGAFNAWQVRQRAYWSILAGAFGFTYGGNGIWQMDMPGKIEKQTHFSNYWNESLNYEGGRQMTFVRNLFESRPAGWVPDSTLITSERGSVNNRIQCARAKDYSYLLAYSTSGHDFSLDLSLFKSKKLSAWWFNPRDGKLYRNDNKRTAAPFEIMVGPQSKDFNPPGDPAENNDWVLIVDDASKSFIPPGGLHK